MIGFSEKCFNFVRSGRIRLKKKRMHLRNGSCNHESDTSHADDRSLLVESAVRPAP